MSRKTDMEVSAILGLVRMCQNLNVLPQAGGLLDQDAYFVFILEQVMLADEERRAIEQSRAKAAMH